MKITFVLLLLILVGGLGYIFISSKTSNKKISNNKVTPTLIPTKAPIPSITPIQEFTGKIVKIEVSDENKQELILSLVEKSDKTITTIKFYFSINKAGLKKMKIIGLTGENISYKNLKVDQNIKLNLNYDSTKFSYSGAKITIVN